MAAQACAALRNHNTLYVKSRKRAGRERRVVEQVAVVDFFHGYDGLRRGVRHCRQLALAADPDIAEAVSHRGVE